MNSKRILRASAVNWALSNVPRTVRRLWNISRDNMGCLKGLGGRPRAPPLAEFLAPVIREMDPEEGIEEQYKVRCTLFWLLHGLV